MDYIKDLGFLALGSRLKRLSDNFMKDVALVYKSQGIDFDPKWFPLFHLLLNHSPLSIMECAKRLSVSHPAVNQFANQMLKKKLIEEISNGSDKRKRFIKVSNHGIEFSKKLKPVWNNFTKALDIIFDNSNFDMVGAIDDIEHQLEEKKYYDRVSELIKNEQLTDVDIIGYQKKYNDDFERLNVEWLEKYFRVEDFDKKVFANPQKEIIKKGGHIIFAKYQNEIVGTVALIKTEDGSFELAKMAVTEKVQGKQIGKKLMIAALQKAKESGVEKVMLVSNTLLEPAINMYKKFGFKQVPLTNKERAKYERSNIKMELIL